MTVHFRKAAVIYNHWVKCRLCTVVDLLLFELETGHGAEVKADAEQLLCYVCARLVFLLLKSHFCMNSCVWRNFSTSKKKKNAACMCVLAEGGLAFVFANQ